MINIQDTKDKAPALHRETGSSQHEQVENLILDCARQYSNEPYVVTRQLMDTVLLLIDTEADDDTIAVAVLRHMRSTVRVETDTVSKRLGYSVARLYLGTEQLDTLSINVGRGEVQSEVSNQHVDFSKILVAVVDDPRVVVIHLAESLIQLREAKLLTDKDQQNLANQVLSMYTPLANKLGMWRFKWELEDLSFKYTNRPEFNRIAKQLDGRREEREAYINAFVSELQALMDRSNIKAVVTGRAKHLYGIWRKLNRKGVQFDNLFDVRAVRILVDDVASCYAALGAVHASWNALAQEFDDYIAAPKTNGYQSLHTAIFGPDSKTVEVQIRTWQMHNDCEFGVAAHWLYKEDNKSGVYQEGKIRLLRQLMDWKAEVADRNSEKSSATDDDSLANTYVFTPAGKVVELPAFSTPIDFAYSIHTEVGHRCRGARVNGRMVPLTHVLSTGDWVEIQTAKSGGPSRDWLSSHHNFVVSARARGCIRRWFKLEEYSRYEAQGKVLLEKELAKHNLSKVNFDKLASSNGYKSSQVFLASIGMKELKPSHAISSLVKPDPVSLDFKPSKRLAQPNTPSLSVLGVGNLLTNHASCCSPLPGDDVIGYITVARGITIHKRSCGNVGRMLEDRPDRMVPVDWEYDEEANYPVDIELFAEGNPNLLQEITTAMANSGTNLIALNTPPIRQNDVGRISLSVEINSADKLKKVLTRLRGIDGVLRARRLKN